MNSVIKKYLKIIIVIVIISLFLWFLVLKPAIVFKKYENTMLKAAQRYYVLNSTQLPTGDRIATVTLQELFYGAYIKEDLYIPNSEKPCDTENSWVKVKHNKNDYEYTVYLKCGGLESKVDHKGPVITLKGKDVMTIEKGSKFTDPGVEKIVDNVDGIIDSKSIIVRGDTVDTSKVGTYEIEYLAVDSFNNKTTVTRQVIVKETLKNTIRNVIGNDYFKGDKALNNYIRISNMLFRMIKIENGNIIAVADEDIANVDYDGIDKWLDEVYMNSFNEKSKKYLVKNEYCMDPPSGDPKAKCKNKTNARYAYILNDIDIQNTKDEAGFSYLKAYTMSWVASARENPVITRIYFYDEYFGKDYYPVNKNDSYGVRPVITINGKSEIEQGNGTRKNPYTFNEIKEARGGDNLNTRSVGEYVVYSGYTWRIVELPSDGTTKVVMTTTLKKSDDETLLINYAKKNIYNPKERNNVGHYINNKATEYVDTNYFVEHNINVKLYDKRIIYGKETKTKTYKVLFSAPDMHDMFSAPSQEENMGSASYWMTNSTTNGKYCAVIAENLAAINMEIDDRSTFGVKLTGYLNKNVTVNSGEGTYEKPYVIKK